ncbi:MAG: 3-isopropylmalate dehydratase small subunit [Dehalococcoidia bacterium]|nr:3-isopropylmalate dehydratase small subunit [Dehalococcoidia bacterium]MDD5647742.1 3-isopropylmalate dehydratase small subunit [Dehalococcoidia bacterium]
MLKGRAFKFGDDISTDLIIAGKYAHLRSNLPELAKHAMEDANPDFIKQVKPGDFIVAGSNFGLGSSREHAPLVIKMAGVSAILAKSFARIFFRNAINQGVPALICPTDKIANGDTLEISLDEGIIRNITKNETYNFTRIPAAMLNILNEGGLIPYINKHGDLKL